MSASNLPVASARLSLFDEYLPGWQMSAAERSTLLHVLHVSQPAHAVEIGTAQGGSLSAIAKFAGQVYTLDKETSCAETLGPQFTNVRFLTGSSAETLPPLIEELNAAQAALGFALIDGSHERAKVRADIENLLKFHPMGCELYVLMHDSFNPECRAGIAEADWAASPYVHRVELDFVTGVFHEREGIAGQMWGGFALALLRPEKREGELHVKARQDLLFQTVLAALKHAPRNER